MQDWTCTLFLRTRGLTDVDMPFHPGARTGVLRMKRFMDLLSASAFRKNPANIIISSGRHVTLLTELVQF